MKFTFKTEKPTGKWKSFSNTSHYIKLNKKEVGTISHEEPFKIRLMVIKKDINEDGNANCEWKWVTLTHESKTLQEAKDFLNKMYYRIREIYNLYLFEAYEK